MINLEIMTPDTKEFEPCPKCGRNRNISIYYWPQRRHGEKLFEKFTVCCQGCYYIPENMAAKNPVEAIEIWNKNAKKIEEERNEA